MVADGNTQKQGVDFDHVFATVVKLSSIRIVLVLAARFGWKLWQLDVKQAFPVRDMACVPVFGTYVPLALTLPQGLALRLRRWSDMEMKGNGDTYPPITSVSFVHTKYVTVT